jgi:hypothetical protein
MSVSLTKPKRVSFFCNCCLTQATGAEQQSKSYTSHRFSSKKNAICLTPKTGGKQMAPLPKDDYLTAANAITKQSSSYASF